METLQIISIAIEALIVIVALAGFLKKKYYLLGFALTFAIYVYYDLAKLQSWEVSTALLYPLFFVATLSAFVSIITVYRKN